VISPETPQLVDYDLVPAAEIFDRLSRLQESLAETTLDGAIIVDVVNLFYFTGTIQQGVLFVPREGNALFFIRSSLERAERETPIKSLIPLKHFDEIAGHITENGHKSAKLGVDETTIPVTVFKKVSRAFPKSVFEDIGFTLATIRAVKSDYEVELIREAGKRHKIIYDKIPNMISEGITEWELGSAILAEMLNLGFTGVGRLATFNNELFGGAISFGDSGNYPTSSVGPDGLVGLSPAFPLLGGARRLKRNEIIFVDTGFSYHGYYTDKTRMFCLGGFPQAAKDAHKTCLDIQEALRWRL